MGYKADNQGWQIQLSLRKCDLKKHLDKGRKTDRTKTAAVAQQSNSDASSILCAFS